MTSQRVFETGSIDLAFPATAGHGATNYRNTGKPDVFSFTLTSRNVFLIEEVKS